jgi:thioredoxin-dependent peroxiredoxin
LRFSTRVRVAVTSATTTAAALIKVARHRPSVPRRQLTVGDVAPEFALQASDGRTYRLIDYRHRHVVVLAWFPKAFTTGCTAQCQSIGAHAEALRARGAIVFGANVDTPETNRQFAAALGLAFPILSDPCGTTARAYGVLGASGLPSRWTFYIGADGRVLSIDKAVRVSTNGVDIERALDGWTGAAPATE